MKQLLLELLWHLLLLPLLPAIPRLLLLGGLLLLLVPTLSWLHLLLLQKLLLLHCLLAISELLLLLRRRRHQAHRLRLHGSWARLVHPSYMLRWHLSGVSLYCARALVNVGRATIERADILHSARTLRRSLSKRRHGWHCLRRIAAGSPSGTLLGHTHSPTPHPAAS